MLRLSLAGALVLAVSSRAFACHWDHTAKKLVGCEKATEEDKQTALAVGSSKTANADKNKRVKSGGAASAGADGADKGAAPGVLPAETKVQLDAMRDRIAGDFKGQAGIVNGIFREMQGALQEPKNWPNEATLAALEDSLRNKLEADRLRFQAKRAQGPEREELLKRAQEATDKYFSTMDQIGEPFHTTAYMASYTKATQGRDWGTNGGRPDQQAGHGRDMERNNPRNPFGPLFNANLKLQNGDAAGAAADASRAIELGGGADAFSMRAAANFAQGNIQAAYDDAKAALKLDPSNQAAFATMKLAEGRGAHEGGAEGQAMAKGENGAGTSNGSGGGAPASAPAAASSFALSDGASGASARASQGFLRDAEAALKVGDIDRALSRANRALELNGSDAGAFYMRSQAYLRQREYNLAAQDASAGLKVLPKNKALLVTKAFASNRRKDFRSALESSNAALEVDPRSAEAFANRAYALGAMGDRSAILHGLRDASALDPRYQASLDSAVQMPKDSDLLFLFPSEAGGEGSAPAQAPKTTRTFGVVAIASLIGGLLIAFGFLQAFAGPLTTRVKSAFTRIGHRSPAVTAMRAEDRESLAETPALLRGQYRIIRQIGAGGMGMVFEGEDATLGRRVAIKKMRDELRLDRRERESFIREAKVVAALHHANIVDIYAIVEENDEIFLVFEYVSGKTVDQLLGDKGPLSYQESLGIFRGMAAALDSAHGRGVVHRDLKPSNVMVSDEGYVKVMDFGIARVAKDAATRLSMTLASGTLPYMAPEQEQGQVRRESDVYSLGVCLYEMLCGHVPFSGSAGGMQMNKLNMSYVAPSAMVGGLPAGLDEIMAKALQPDPAKRFASAKEMMVALNDLFPARGSLKNW